MLSMENTGEFTNILSTFFTTFENVSFDIDLLIFITAIYVLVIKQILFF